MVARALGRQTPLLSAGSVPITIFEQAASTRAHPEFCGGRTGVLNDIRDGVGEDHARGSPRSPYRPLNVVDRLRLSACVLAAVV